MRWNDIEEIVENLEENYPDEELSEITLPYLEEMIKSLSDFEGYEEEVNKEILKKILEAWIELRQ